VLCVSRAQLPGGKAMAVRDLLNARQTPLSEGVRLGQPSQPASQGAHP
jgi:methionyl-tRNA formyltransferase